MAMDRRRQARGYVPLRDAIDQLFEGSVLSPHFLGGSGGHPEVDVYVTDEEVVVEMAVPGANPDDINISVTGDTVSIAGEVKRRRRAEKVQPFLDEIWEGRFQRSFQLPIQVDANRAEASFENGILTLVLPKSEATRPRKIQVRGQQQTIQGEQTQASGSSS